MARVIRDNPISTTVSDDEKVELEKLDFIIDKSRAEFIRDVVMKETRKLLKKAK